jgi:hypothetical protein
MKVRVFSQQNRHPSKVAVLAIFLLIKAYAFAVFNEKSNLCGFSA